MSMIPPECKDDPFFYLKMKKDILDKRQEMNWDMSQERKLIETILSQRFNFFLLFFAIVFIGSIHSKSQMQFVIILSINTIILWFMSFNLFRIQQKLDLISEHLRQYESHPVSIIDKLAKGPRTRRLVGYVVPFFCCLIFSIASILAFYNILTLPK